MKLDAMLGLEPGRAGTLAAELERLGYDGLWTAETQHDPFLPLAVAAGSTSRMTLGTAIATAFTRSPMVAAMLAWDLQQASGGRFVLGLGTQVKGHNERRFSVPFESPGPKLRELVEALRHIWGAFQGEHPLGFRGRFYRHDLMTPFFDPGPIDHSLPPVYLAAVTPYMYGLAGEVADGVHVHPFHTIRYLREVALPALERGGRRGDVTLVAPVFTVVGGDDEAVRLQIAFYGSTRTYRPVLELHGWGELGESLYRQMARGDVDGMAAAIGDDVLTQFAVFGSTWEEATRALRERCEGLVERVGVYGMDAGDAEQIARYWFSSSSSGGTSRS
jgi:probable F420-dependent oxidoreductase